MKTLVIAFIMSLPVVLLGQTAEESFHLASVQYIHEKMREAKSTVENALKKYPTDPKLNALREKIKEDEKQQQQQDQENQDQQNQDQQEKEEKEQQEKEQKEKEQQEKEKKEQERKEKEKKDSKENPEPQDEEQKDQPKPQDMDQQREVPPMSPEKAKMVLEAMKNMERQYLQQNKRKATKSRDRGKPDW